MFQAPKCLKTVTIAAWYLSVAFGNFLVIVITQAKLFKSQVFFNFTFKPCFKMFSKNDFFKFIINLNEPQGL